MVFLFWKLISLLSYFKFYSHQKIFGSGHQKAPTNTQSPIFPANRARKFPNQMASKAESTLSRRCKNFVAVQGSAHCGAVQLFEAYSRCKKKPKVRKNEEWPATLTQIR